MKLINTSTVLILTTLICSTLPPIAFADSDTHPSDVQKLVSALKGPTPIIDDLQELTDEIGARMTGTIANEQAIEWGVNKFKSAGVSVRKEVFTMPRSWVENNAFAHVTSEKLDYKIPLAAMPFTKASGKSGLQADIVFLNKGTLVDFNKHSSLKNKWLIVETDVLDDEAGIHGLFQEYVDSVGIEDRAEQAGAAGLIYMSSRPQNLLYRHLPSDGADNKLPIVVIEREEASKIKRLLNKGHQLSFNAYIDIAKKHTYQTHNVVAEIKGSTYPEQIVLIGAHIDTFDLGTGALDNGSNVNLVIDIARQIKKLNIKPKRTIRFALFNGEEQGIFGSWGYTKTHKSELKNHVIASTIDIGTGKITGFFTNGREEITPELNNVLSPVNELGPFDAINVTVVGTDNYDFMMNGVANLVANQADSNYASNYHAESDTFDKVDQKQLKLNAAVMGAMTLGFANSENIHWQKLNRYQVEQLVEKFDVEASMKTFGLYNNWKNKTRPIR